MLRIGLLSDTHGYLDSRILAFFAEVDEVWHAGDIGSVEVAEALERFRPLRAVYGNIDGADLRRRYPVGLRWNCEGILIRMIHIGGYPGRYEASLKREFETSLPGLLICGHSHILRVMHDSRFGFMYMNPGAAGNYGWHTVKTALRFSVSEGKPMNLEVLEMKRDGTFREG